MNDTTGPNVYSILGQWEGKHFHTAYDMQEALSFVRKHRLTVSRYSVQYPPAPATIHKHTYIEVTRKELPVMANTRVYYRTEAENKEYGFLNDDRPPLPMPAGWYYDYCFPGCLPESEPFGPYDTEEAALAAIIDDDDEYNLLEGENNE